MAVIKEPTKAFRSFLNDLMIIRCIYVPRNLKTMYKVEKAWIQYMGKGKLEQLGLLVEDTNSAITIIM